MRVQPTGFQGAIKTAVIAAVIFALADQAQAQGSSAESAKIDAGDDLAEIVVTARRVEERLQDVPVSITVFSEEDLRKRNVAIATDLGAFTPSLSVNQRFGPEKAAFAIRGFNAIQDSAPTVGVYFAEATAVHAQGGTPGGNTVGAGAFTDLASVQVLKGAQGTLFGRNTTGGAIMLTPQKPTDQFGGYAEASYGSYNQMRVGGALNLPLSDAIRVRLTVEHNQRDGYMENHAAQGPRDYNDINYLYGRLSVAADLTPDLENYLIAHYSRSKTHGYASHIDTCSNGTFTGAGLLQVLSCREQFARQAARGDGPYDVENNIIDPEAEPQQWQVINTTTFHASEKLTVKNILTYGEYRERLNLAYLSTNFTVPNVNNSGGFLLGTALLPAGARYVLFQSDGGGRGTNAAAESTLTEEIQLQGKTSSDRLSYVVGGYLEKSRPIGYNLLTGANFANCLDLEALNCSNPLTFASYNQPRQKLSFDTYGIFGQGTFKLTDKLSLTAGVRWTSDKVVGIDEATRFTLTTAAGSTVDPATGVSMRRTCGNTLVWGTTKVVVNPADCAVRHSVSSEKPTGSLDLAYAFSPDLMVYGKVARGYRQGGLKLASVGFESWGPESMDSYELGAKTSFGDGAVKGYFNVSAFYNNLQDMQVLAQLIPTAAATLAGVSPASAIINAGKARSYGLEIDSSVRLFQALRVSLGYALLKTKVVEVASSADLAPLLVGTAFASANPQVAKGTGFLDTPEQKLTLNATYTLPLDSALGEFAIGATWTHTSKVVTNFADPEFFQGVPVGITPSNDLVNLNIDWAKIGGSPFSASAYATNLTDEVVRIPNQFPFAFSGGAVHSGYMAPRMYGVRVKYDFGK